MECEYGHNDCQNLDKKCALCFDSSWYLEPKKKSQGLKKRNYNKTSGRMGSQFEMNNHKQNANILKDIVSSGMTPNSGAANVKGDEQIRGIVNIMEELKTQEPDRARGTKQFTIKKDWLDKLDVEGAKEKMEFWYLKFAFKDNDTQSYTVIDTEQMMGMVATIIHDRKIAQEADSKVDVANKRREYVEAENTALIAKINLLEALLKQHDIKID